MPDYTHIKGVYIKTPCHENWEAMDEDEKGRFCTVCTKTVYDFTTATPEEFFKTYRENKGQICGRFYAQPQSFWGTAKKNTLQILRQSKAAFFAIGLGIISHKSGSAQILQTTPIENVAEVADSEFASLSFKIRDSYTAKIVKQDFKVTIVLEGYSLVINKVSNGVATFQIPKELINTRAVITIEGEGISTVNETAIMSYAMGDSYVAATKRAKRLERKYPKRVSRTMGCPDF